MTATGWEAWAPPLDPPVTPGGLPIDQAQAIADAYWDDSPHLCAALQWEAYAATLPQTPSVRLVHTGIQAIQYEPPAPGGDFGMAMARADWHRSFLVGVIQSLPLRLAPPCAIEITGGSGWRDYDEPHPEFHDPSRS